jgi:hypothetical protein
MAYAVYAVAQIKVEVEVFVQGGNGLIVVAGGIILHKAV